MDLSVTEKNKSDTQPADFLKVTPLCDSSVYEGDDSALPLTVFNGATLRQNLYFGLHGISFRRASGEWENN